MPRKLIVVYNPQSSRRGLVQEEVIAPARKLAGWMVGKYRVTTASLEENARALMKILSDGDLVIAAGGDGTATVAANAVMWSQKKVTFSTLGYGNFNDLTYVLGTRRPVRRQGELVGGIAEIVAAFEAGKTTEIWPLEIIVNDKQWRYALCYVTMGLFAESTEVFDETKVRQKLQSGKRTPVFSWRTLARWYFQNRKKRVFVPEFRLNGEKMPTDVTDYVAVNGARMAGVMRGGDWYLDPKHFGRAMGKLKSFWRLFSLMAKSILRRIPTVMVERDVLEFTKPGSIEVQAEGEYQRLSEVKKIEVSKAERPLLVVKL